MIEAGIYHRATGNFCYPLKDGKVEIRLQTAQNDIATVHLLWGDPYIGHVHPQSNHWAWAYEKTPMSFTGSGMALDYWTVQINPPYRRLKYVFEITDKQGQTLVLSERGLHPTSILEQSFIVGFTLPFVHPNEVHETPDWVLTTAWYQIFPERFHNGNPDNDPKPHAPWGQLPVNNHTFYGGDLQGITAKLDYIQELGFTGIYMTPIFESPSGHKYDTVDYFKIDPGFGTLADMKELVQQAHQRGIRVMLDGVFNHIGNRSKQWLNVLKEQEKSPFKDWFHIHRFPVVEPTGKHDDHTLAFDTFAFTYTMPKLNTQHPEVIKFILDIARYWIKETGIDGWRLDVAGEVDHPFWKEFRKAVRATKTNLFIVGEILNDALPWLQGDEFDSVMNYHLTYHIRDLIADQTIQPTTFFKKVIDLYHQYPSPANSLLFNLIDCHDTARFLTQCKNESTRAYLGHILQYTLPGTPSVYYGDEIGMEGKNDPDCRRCMIWDQKQWNQTTWSLIKSLNHLKLTKGELLSKGSLDLIYADDAVLAFARVYKGERLYIIMNTRSQTQTLRLPQAMVSGINILTEQLVTLPKTLALAPYEFLLVLEGNPS